MLKPRADCGGRGLTTGTKGTGFVAKLCGDLQEWRQSGRLAEPRPSFVLPQFLPLIEILQVKYLNNIVEQNDNFIKKMTKSMRGFKATHTIRKRQFGQSELTSFQQSAALTA